MNIQEQIEQLRSGSSSLSYKCNFDAADTIEQLNAVYIAAQKARIELGFSSNFVVMDLCDAIDAVQTGE